MSTEQTDAGHAEDASLTLAAQHGDLAALGLLLERHGPGMRAVALSLLGPGPDIDDVMQDAALVALRSVGEVRDPGAVGAWLRMVVRNRSRSLLREARRTEPRAEVPLPPVLTTPEQVLDRHAMRNWIWEAVERLSPTLRLPVVLRYFTSGVTSYQQIAEACAIPVGTVRSRLSQARAELARTLRATADGGHDAIRRRTEAGRQEAHESEKGQIMDTYSSLTGRPSKDQQALQALLSRVNCNDRREPGKEATEIEGITRRSGHLAAATWLGLFL